MKYYWHRAIIVCVVVIYVFTTIGVSVISHYCGGELQDVSVFTAPDSCCGGEEEEMPVSDDGCCKNETQHFSYKSDFLIGNATHDVKAPIQYLSEYFYSAKEIQLEEKLGLHINLFKSSHPPDDPVQRHIISVSVLRI